MSRAYDSSGERFVYRAERGETIDDMAHRLGVMLISREAPGCVVLECAGQRRFAVDVEGRLNEHGSGETRHC